MNQYFSQKNWLQAEFSDQLTANSTKKINIDKSIIKNEVEESQISSDDLYRILESPISKLKKTIKGKNEINKRNGWGSSSQARIREYNHVDVVYRGQSEIRGNISESRIRNTQVISRNKIRNELPPGIQFKRSGYFRQYQKKRAESQDITGLELLVPPKSFVQYSRDYLRDKQSYFNRYLSPAQKRNILVLQKSMNNTPKVAYSYNFNLPEIKKVPQIEQKIPPSQQNNDSNQTSGRNNLLASSKKTTKRGGIDIRGSTVATKIDKLRFFNSIATQEEISRNESIQIPSTQDKYRGNESPNDSCDICSSHESEDNNSNFQEAVQKFINQSEPFEDGHLMKLYKKQEEKYCKKYKLHDQKSLMRLLDKQVREQDDEVKQQQILRESKIWEQTNGKKQYLYRNTLVQAKNNKDKILEKSCGIQQLLRKSTLIERALDRQFKKRETDQKFSSNEKSMLMRELDPLVQGEFIKSYTIDGNFIHITSLEDIILTCKINFKNEIVVIQIEDTKKFNLKLNVSPMMNKEDLRKHFEDNHVINGDIHQIDEYYKDYYEFHKRLQRKNIKYPLSKVFDDCENKQETEFVTRPWFDHKSKEQRFQNIHSLLQEYSAAYKYKKLTTDDCSEKKEQIKKQNQLFKLANIYKLEQLKDYCSLRNLVLKKFLNQQYINDDSDNECEHDPDVVKEYQVEIQNFIDGHLNKLRKEQQKIKIGKKECFEKVIQSMDIDIYNEEYKKLIFNLMQIEKISKEEKQKIKQKAQYFVQNNKEMEEELNDPQFRKIGNSHCSDFINFDLESDLKLDIKLLKDLYQDIQALPKIDLHNLTYGLIKQTINDRHRETKAELQSIQSRWEQQKTEEQNFTNIQQRKSITEKIEENKKQEDIGESRVDQLNKDQTCLGLYSQSMYQQCLNDEGYHQDMCGKVDVEAIHEQGEVFQDLKKKLKYYQEIKNNKKNMENVNLAEIRYFTELDIMSNKRPHFCNIKNGVLSLVNQRMSIQECKALKNYLIGSVIPGKRDKQLEALLQNNENNKEKLSRNQTQDILDELHQRKIMRKNNEVKILIIDDLSFKDEMFRLILEGVTMQQNVIIEQIVYHNGEVGQLTTEYFEKILNKEIAPNLEHFSLSNNKGSHLSVLVKQLCCFLSKIKRLKFMRMAPSDETIYEISQLIQNSEKNLQELDLSWLSIKSLQMISKALPQCQSLKSLNLQYLKVDKYFVENLVKFVQNSHVLMHLNINGLQLKEDELILLIEKGICKSKSLIGVHLNGNNLEEGSKLRTKIIHLLGIKMKETSEINASLPIKFENIMEKPNSHKENENIYINQGILKRFWNEQNLTHQAISFGKSTWSGSASHPGSINSNKSVPRRDEFVIWRVLGHNELIFSANEVQNDLADECWQLNQVPKQGIYSGDECYFCEKYRFTHIYYDRIMKDKQFWEQINDKRLIDQLRQIVKNKFVKDGITNTMSPILFSTMLKESYVSMTNVKLMAAYILQSNVVEENCKLNNVEKDEIPKRLKILKKNVRNELIDIRNANYNQKKQLIKRAQTNCKMHEIINSLQFPQYIHDNMINWRLIFKQYLRYSSCNDAILINYPLLNKYIPSEFKNHLDLIIEEEGMSQISQSYEVSEDDTVSAEKDIEESQSVDISQEENKRKTQFQIVENSDEGSSSFDPDHDECSDSHSHSHSHSHSELTSHDHNHDHSDDTHHDHADHQSEQNDVNIEEEVSEIVSEQPSKQYNQFQIKQDQIFCYMNFVKPGCHTLIIYDPQIGRFFKKLYVIGYDMPKVHIHKEDNGDSNRVVQQSQNYSVRPMHAIKEQIIPNFEQYTNYKMFFEQDVVEIRRLWGPKDDLNFYQRNIVNIERNYWFFVESYKYLFITQQLNQWVNLKFLKNSKNEIIVDNRAQFVFIILERWWQNKKSQNLEVYFDKYELKQISFRKDYYSQKRNKIIHLNQELINLAYSFFATQPIVKTSNDTGEFWDIYDQMRLQDLSLEIRFQLYENGGIKPKHNDDSPKKANKKADDYKIHLFEMCKTGKKVDIFVFIEYICRIGIIMNIKLVKLLDHVREILIQKQYQIHLKTQDIRRQEILPHFKKFQIPQVIEREEVDEAQSQPPLDIISTFKNAGLELTEAEKWYLENTYRKEFEAAQKLNEVSDSEISDDAIDIQDKLQQEEWKNRALLN